MKRLFYIFFTAFLCFGCSPASKHEQLEKLLSTGTDLFDAGYSTDALPYMEQALDFSIREFKEMSPETAKVSKSLAFIFYEKRMFGSARKEYSRLIRILNNIPGKDRTDLIEAYQKLCQISLAFEDIEGARELTERILFLQKKFISAYNEGTLDSTFRLARIHDYLKNKKECFEYFDQTIEILEQMHGENCVECVKYLSSKLELFIRDGDVKGRIKTLSKLIQVMRNTTGETSIATAEYLNMLTDALMEDENFEEASKICLEALKINEKSLEKNSPALINTYRKLASVEYFLSNHEKMEELLIKAIECAESDSLNEDLYEKVLLSLSAYYMESKRYKNAETQLMKLLNIRKNKLSDIHPDLIENHNMLAQCFTFQKEYIKAQASLEEGFDVVAHSFGKTSSQALNQIDQMAFLSYKAKKYPQAITRCQETIEMLKKQYPDNHQNYLPFYKRLSLIFKTTKDLQKATDFSLKALKVSEFVHGTESTRIVVDLTDISDLYKLRKMPTKAILFAERGVKILEKDKNSDRQYLATALNDLAALYEVAGDKDKANSLYKRSRDIDKATP